MTIFAWGVDRSETGFDGGDHKVIDMKAMAAEFIVMTLFVTGITHLLSRGTQACRSTTDACWRHTLMDTTHWHGAHGGNLGEVYGASWWPGVAHRYSDNDRHTHSAMTDGHIYSAASSSSTQSLAATCTLLGATLSC